MDSTCSKCHGTGIIETGNNDMPCDCSAGDVAVFNVTTLDGKQMTGAQVRERDKRTRRAAIEALADFWRCPNSGRIIEGMKGDDKVLCNCRKTNPRVAAVGHREAPGVHIKAYLQPATIDEWTQQREERRP